MKQLFIFRGSPASGKGTITKSFTERLTGRVALLELDKFRWGIHLIGRTVPDVGEDEHILAYQNLLAVLNNYLANGTYTIVLEGLFSWDTPGPHGNMQDVLSLASRHRYAAYPILLTAPYEVLWERNTERAYAVPEEEFKELYGYVMHTVGPDEIRVPVDRQTVEESVAQLLAFINPHTGL